jgi:1-pyrroline-5-carboxylate dehydrogenase
MCLEENAEVWNYGKEKVMLPEFRNEPFTDFTQVENVGAFESALARVRGRLGRRYSAVVGGERVDTDATFDSTNPTRPDEVIGTFTKSDKALAERAIQTAYDTFQDWQYVPPEERARYLFKAAAIMRRRKHEFSACMVYEVGKNWVEADVDTAEAIDFLEYYGRQMLKLSGPQPLTPYPPEEVDLRYIPLGVGAVIPPWNFGSIMAGMSAASIVAGNTVVLKPSSASPAIAALFVEIMEEAGLPPGVLNYVPGLGGEIGDFIVTHPKIRFIAFTGSKEIGLRINRLAAQPRPGQIWIKRCVLEMGGKDAVVVDETADLAAAAEGIVISAFGYQGQKCSAGSRAIVVEDVYDEVVERVVARAKKITIGDPVDRQNWLGPVIDEDAFQKVMSYIEIGTEEGRLLLGGHALNRPGYFIEPTIFADVPSDARIAQEEIFGPVLAVIKARDFDDALAIANGTEYGLTGSLYSRSRARLERARREFHVGNLYFNRKCTGALVGVHPFGGFNMSGTDSKAGGPDYLLLFTQAKSIGERL